MNPPAEPRTRSPLGLQVPLHRSVVFRAVVFSTTLAAVLLGICLAYTYFDRRDATVETLGHTLKSIAATAAPGIRGEDALAVRSNGDASGDAFKRILGVLQIIKNQNELRDDQVYVLRPDPAGDGLYRFVAMLQDKTFIGDEYRPPAQVEALYQQVFKDGMAVRTELFTDDHGSFISGIAPIKTERGDTAAILQVDYGVGVYLAAIAESTRILAMIGGAILLILVAFGVFQYQYLRTQVRKLLEGTAAIAAENYTHLIPVTSDDELGTLAVGLNASLGKLRERFEMLKFLPSHTARMIQTALDSGADVDLHNAQRIRVAVLETDIRGFTKLSSSMTPEEVISMLNSYIRAQAEIISQHGGSIDKYMGDAVLAVFEGEGLEERSLLEAAEIQMRIAAMNRDPASPFPFVVNVGAGLSVGEVVMGNMGSEQRMEHTVIGSIVNLAARLCSAAKAGEVVVTAELFSAIKRPLGIQGQLDEVDCKGFADPIATMRLTPGEVRSISSLTLGDV